MAPKAFSIEPNPHRNPGNTGTFIHPEQYKAELAFVELAHVCGMDIEYEPHTMYLPELNCYFTPDFWVEEHQIYIEISATSMHRPKRQRSRLQPKRHRIRLVAKHCGIPVLILHTAHWPKSREELLYLIRRAELAATFEHYDPREET